MAVFDGVRYSLSPSLSPTRRNELAAVLDLNAFHAHTNATSDPAVKLVTDRWVDRSVVMGKQQPEQYYSPDPAMIFSGVVACATDLSVADLEVLSAGVTALGGQWRVGLTRDVTHLFALRTGSDKYNTALHFAPQTHMCILTPHWFDDAVRLGRRVPEAPYSWPDPPVLRPGVTLDLDDDALATEGRRKRKPEPEAGDGTNIHNEGEHVRVWAGRRILLSVSLELADGSRRAIEARIQRAGGVTVPISEDADEDAEERAVDGCDVLVTRWRSGKSYFKAARASLLIGSLSWLFSVESSSTLHSPLDSLLWYPTPRGGIPNLIDCEISITNYTGAARDYLKRLITLIGAKFTPSMSQSNKVLIAGFQPSPKTTRALSWSIPVVNHTWLEDCFVEWRALTVGLERYIVYPPGVDFGKILMTPHDGPPSSQTVPTQRLGSGAVPGGRGISTVDVEQEKMRDAEYLSREGRGTLGLSTSREAFADATTADGMSTSLLEGDILKESGTRPRSRAGSVKKTPSSSVKRRSISTPMTVSATGAFVDQVIELPGDEEDDADGKRRTPAKGKQRARTSSVGLRATPRSMSKPSSTGLFSAAREVGVAVRTSGRRLDDENEKEKGKDNAEKPAQTSALRRRAGKAMSIGSDLDSHADAGEGESEVSVPPRRATGAGSATPVKSGMKPRPRSRSQSRPRSELDRDSEDEMRAVATKSGPLMAKKRQKEVAKPARHGGVGINEKVKEATRKETKKVTPRSRSPTRSPSPASPDTNNSRTPKRRLSVLVPSVPRQYFSSQGAQDALEAEGNHERETRVEQGRDAGTTLGTKRKQLSPSALTHAIAAEMLTSTSKRARSSPLKQSAPPAVSGTSKPQPQAKTKAKSKPGVSKETTRTRADEHGSTGKEQDNRSSIIVDVPKTITSRGGPRRSAANRATTRLREEIMPDVVSFEKEQKHAKRRRSVGGESVASVRWEEGEREERNAKKRKVAVEAEEEEEEAEVVDVVLVSSVKAKPKPTNGKGKGKAKGTSAVGSDEDTDNLSTKNKQSSTKGACVQGKELAAVRLMTTGVVLSDDVIKRLTKLGVQMTTKPTDCTHLIAKGIVRTEKFLCAMSVSPYILTEEWANASAKGGKLLPESDYLLSDAAAERKWGFKFVDAMARAMEPEGGSNLFKKMTFYVTPKVSVDAKLLKNVISAGGGQMQTSTTPTVRILKGKANRYVVSCQEDRVIWRPLAQEGFKIYSPELVLRGALRQEIEWEKEECLVVG